MASWQFPVYCGQLLVSVDWALQTILKAGSSTPKDFLKSVANINLPSGEAVMLLIKTWVSCRLKKAALGAPCCMLSENCVESALFEGPRSVRFFGS